MSAMIEAMAITDKDMLICSLPLFHAYAANFCCMMIVAAGATEVIEARFSPTGTPDTIQKYGVTVYPAVPTMLTYILNAKIPKEKLSSLRYCMSGGSVLNLQMVAEFEKTYGIKIHDAWGTTEVSSFSLMTRAGAFKNKTGQGSCGIALSGTFVKVFDKDGKEVPRGQEGEMVIKGPHVMTQYINQPEATVEAFRHGHFWTGDLVIQDEDGFFYIKGRNKELIISGGYNIYPKEIEDVLLSKKGILEAAVVGVADPGKGEVPKAFVVLEEGSKLTEEEILNYLKENVARYKQPKYVQIIKEIPKTPSGKTKKFMLK
jgi:long-chain acyl-CoA synthetase